jgi:hypothetical protein
MTTAHWTSALSEFLDVVLADLATFVRECPDDVWELSMWDVTKDQGWGRPQPPMLANGDPDPRGVDAHSAVWYTTLHLVYSLDHNFSGRASLWEPPPPFRKGDLDDGRLPQRTYTREELLSYISYVHEKARTTLAAVAADESTLAGDGRTSADWLVGGFGHAMAHFGNLQTFLWQHRR